MGPSSLKELTASPRITVVFDRLSQHFFVIEALTCGTIGFAPILNFIHYISICCGVQENPHSVLEIATLAQ